MERIIVVANAPTVRGRRLGATIDGYDLVVRCNCFCIDGYEEDVGTKITHWGFSEHREASQRLLRENKTLARVHCLQGLWYWRSPVIPPESYLEFRAMTSFLPEEIIEHCSRDIPRWALEILKLPRPMTLRGWAVRKVLKFWGLEVPSGVLHALNHRWLTPPVVRVVRRGMQRFARDLPYWAVRRLDPTPNVNTGVRVLLKVLATWPNACVHVAGFGNERQPTGYYFAPEVVTGNMQRDHERRFVEELVRAGRIHRVDS